MPDVALSLSTLTKNSSRLHLGIASRGSLDQTPEAQIVHNVLDPLDLVLYAVSALADDVILEVEQLEAGEEVLDEGADGEGKLEVAEGDGVCGEAGEVLGEVNKGEEIFFYGEVEGVAVFEVCWDCAWSVFFSSIRVMMRVKMKQREKKRRRFFKVPEKMAPTSSRVRRRPISGAFVDSDDDSAGKPPSQAQ